MIKKSVILILLIGLPFMAFSQSSNDVNTSIKSNKELYASFKKFYNNSIQKETKGNRGVGYYKINQISSPHYLDYNEDGFKDVLVEFSVSTLNKKENHFLIAVLFKNANGRYKYIAHMNPENTTFVNYSKSIFHFSGGIRNFTDGVVIEEYTLFENKFIRQ